MIFYYSSIMPKSKMGPSTSSIANVKCSSLNTINYHSSSEPAGWPPTPRERLKIAR